MQSSEARLCECWEQTVTLLLPSVPLCEGLNGVEGFDQKYLMQGRRQEKWVPGLLEGTKLRPFLSLSLSLFFFFFSFSFFFGAITDDDGDDIWRRHFGLRLFYSIPEWITQYQKIVYSWTLHSVHSVFTPPPFPVSESVLRDMQANRERQRQKERDRNRSTERQTETEDSDRETERDRDGVTETQTETETDIQTETQTRVRGGAVQLARCTSVPKLPVGHCRVVPQHRWEPDKCNQKSELSKWTHIISEHQEYVLSLTRPVQQILPPFQVYNLM